jgi:ATP-dependent helicase/nuclease subunit A
MATKPIRIAPDEAARRRALNPEISALVQAPAGSGKTELLIQRYLSLLPRVAEPESVVAITFTIKAAGEMRGRILEALRSANGPQPEQPHEIVTWRLAREALEHDRIRRWRLSEDPSRMRIQTIDALCLSLARRLPVLSGFGGHPTPNENAGSLYARASDRTVCLLEEDGPASGAVQVLLRHLGNDLTTLSRLFQQMLSRRDQWLRLLGGGAADTALLRHTLERNLSRLPEIEASSYSPTQWLILEALLQLIPHAVTHLRDEFRRAGQVDFIEVSLAARQALGPQEQPTDLALALGEQIEHLLIDEMQDTSRTHFEIIERICNGWESADPTGSIRTLFLVGDPMQSIYRFREADVNIFLELQRGAAVLPLEPISLSANFRSERGIVDWINGAFSQVFSKTSDPSIGAVSYTASTVVNPAEREPAVQVHALIGKNAAVEASLVARLAQEAVEAGDHTAILVRARTHLPAIVSELKRRTEANAKLRFRAVDVDSLNERPVIADLIALTRALLHPADRTSWLAVLRAPWCGLILTDLSRLAGDDSKALIPDLLRNPGVSLDGRKRLARVAPILLEGLDRARRLALPDLVEDVWIALDGPRCLSSPEEHVDARAFLRLLGELGVGGSLSSFAELELRTAQLFAAPDPESPALLEILTIHKAKGLEFDTVIVPGLGHQTRPEERELLTWTTSAHGDILIAPIRSQWDEQDEISKHVREAEAARDFEESKRLLYVAATRAKRQLHLIGHNVLKKDQTLSQPRKGALLRHLWPIVQPEFEAARLALLSKPSSQSAFNFASSRLVRRLPADWPGGALPPGPEISPQAVTFEWAGETPRQVGRVVHGWLHRIATTGARPPSLATLRAALQHAGVSKHELEEAAARAHDALEATLADSRGRWILSRHDDDRREYELTGRAADQTIRVIVDCTFIDNGVRWVVDFKTSSHQGGSVDAFIDNEVERYRAQLERYASLLRLLGPEPVRLGLYFPLLQGWREWELPVNRDAASATLNQDAASDSNDAVRSQDATHPLG